MRSLILTLMLSAASSPADATPIKVKVNGQKDCSAVVKAFEAGSGLRLRGCEVLKEQTDGTWKLDTVFPGCEVHGQLTTCNSKEIVFDIFDGIRKDMKYSNKRADNKDLSAALKAAVDGAPELK